MSHCPIVINFNHSIFGDYTSYGSVDFKVKEIKFTNKKGNEITINVNNVIKDFDKKKYIAVRFNNKEHSFKKEGSVYYV